MNIYFNLVKNIKIYNKIILNYLFNVINGFVDFIYKIFEFSPVI